MKSVCHRDSIIKIVVVEPKSQLQLVVVRELDQVVSSLDVFCKSNFLRQLHDVRQSFGSVVTVPLQYEFFEPIESQDAIAHIFSFVVADLLEVFLQCLVVHIEVLDSIANNCLCVRIKEVLVSKSPKLDDFIEFVNLLFIGLILCIRSQSNLQIH